MKTTDGYPAIGGGAKTPETRILAVPKGTQNKKGAPEIMLLGKSTEESKREAVGNRVAGGAPCRDHTTTVEIPSTTTAVQTRGAAGLITQFIPAK